MKATVPAMAALLMLAACDNGTQRAGTIAEEAAPQENLPNDDSVAPMPATVEDTGTPAPTTLPAALHGRWGMVPADCASTRGDAKGLLTITANKLAFYESVATLDTVMEAQPNRIRASFDFEGEGMTWERELVLEVQDDGATLIRREYGEDAAPAPFRYGKCT